MTPESARKVATSAPSRTTSHSSRGRPRIPAIGALWKTEKGKPGSLCIMFPVLRAAPNCGCGAATTSDGCSEPQPTGLRWEGKCQPSGTAALRPAPQCHHHSRRSTRRDPRLLCVCMQEVTSQELLAADKSCQAPRCEGSESWVCTCGVYGKATGWRCAMVQLLVAQLIA